MKRAGLQVVNRKRANHCACQGEIMPTVPHLLKQDFRANLPKEKWLTDITEFAMPAGKVYLSLIIDCFNIMPVC